ncbi:MAG: transposase [Chloroflexi bacterium]|nr:transposase [Chloroflexota bacterium]
MNPVFHQGVRSVILVPEDTCMLASDERRTAMFDLVRRWRESGTRARVFAQEHGVTAWTLYYWREQLTKEERPAQRPSRRPRTRMKKPKLVPVRIMPEEGSTLELILTTGDRVRVPGDVGADTLRRVVQVLRTAC